MKRLVLISALALLAAAPSYAGLSLEVTSDHEAKVFLGDSYLGRTPLNIDSIRTGTHTLKVKSIETGDARSYEVVSSRAANTSKRIEATFGGGRRTSRAYEVERPEVRAPQSIEPPRREVYVSAADYYPPRATYVYAAPSYNTPSYCPTPYAASYYSAPPAYAPAYGGYPASTYGGYSPSYPAYGSGYSGGYRQDRSSNNFRNVLLGAGLANEVFNNGRNSRGSIRKGVVGAFLLNELTRGSRGGGGGSGGFGGLFGY